MSKKSIELIWILNFGFDLTFEIWTLDLFISLYYY